MSRSLQYYLFVLALVIQILCKSCLFSADNENDIKACVEHLLVDVGIYVAGIRGQVQDVSVSQSGARD